MTVLVRTSSNCKRQTCRLVRQDATHQQTCNCLTAIKNWSCAPDGCLTPRETGQLTISHNITLILTLNGSVVRWSPAGNAVSTRAEEALHGWNHNQATTSED
jgi:hypothetical protein